MIKPNSAPEVKRLLNPAFLAVVISFAAEGYEDESGEPLPFLLAMLTPPLALHRATRESLPKLVVSKLSEWTKKHPETAGMLPRHTQEFLPFAKQALVLGSNANVIQLQANGSITSLRTQTISKASRTTRASVEIPEILKKSYFVGRWLAHAGTVPTIFSIIGMGLKNENQ